MKTTESHASELKHRVHDYWNRQACGAQNTDRQKFSREYFEEIEQHRYRIEPEILPFAQFPRYSGQKVLEVGVGAGTDFLQWVRAGAQAYGVDLTPEAVEHVRQRLAVYGLEAAEVRVADCENLPFENNTFDVVYSWGVLHHTPDTAKSVAEVVRVTRPGGVCKVMLYHRQSLTGFYLWVKWALLRGRPWRTVAWCFANRVESPGTKAFSRREVERMLEHLPVENVRIQPVLTHQDRLAKHNPLARLVGGLLAAGLGSRAGFYLTIELNKRASGDLNRHSLAVKGVAGQGA